MVDIRRKVELVLARCRTNRNSLHAICLNHRRLDLVLVCVQRMPPRLRSFFESLPPPFLPPTELGCFAVPLGRFCLFIVVGVVVGDGRGLGLGFGVVDAMTGAGLAEVAVGRSFSKNGGKAGGDGMGGGFDIVGRGTRSLSGLNSPQPQGS